MLHTVVLQILYNIHIHMHVKIIHSNWYVSQEVLTVFYRAKWTKRLQVSWAF